MSHRERLVEVLRREQDGGWSRHEARTGGSAQSASIGCALAVDDVHRDPLAVA